MFDKAYKDIADVFFGLIADDGTNCDLALVAQEAKRAKGIDESRVTELIDFANPSLLYKHAKVLNKSWLGREHVKMMQGCISQILEGGDFETAIAQLESEKEMIGDMVEQKLNTRTEDIMSALDSIYKANDAKGGVTGIPTGFPQFDKLTGGWQSGDYVIIAARPGLGKTTLALDFALNAVEAGFSTIFFSLEMTKESIWKKLNSKRSEISLEEMHGGNLSPKQLQHIGTKFEEMYELPLLIKDLTDVSNKWPSIRDKIMEAKRKADIKMIIIDYLQLMNGIEKSGSRNYEIESISRGIKRLAIQLKIPIICLSQLSRAVEVRGGTKRPGMSDLRDSGSLEQDTDKIIFLYRPDYYKIMEDEEGRPLKGIAEMNLAKHRNTGKVDTIELQFTAFNNTYKETKKENLDDSSGEVYNPIIEPRGQKNDDEDIPF